MPTGLKVFLLIASLAVFAILGAFHVPTPGDSIGLPGGKQDITLDALPSLPAWAHDDLPDFSKYQNVTQKKHAFFSFLYPRIVLANTRILIQRQYLETLERKSTLAKSEILWLEQEAERLRVDEEPGSDAMFVQLGKRLDVIPPSLILAQAANESAWGTSRFARQGNNLFGQWCFTKGCGLVPQGREAGKQHEVAAFRSPYLSIQSYIQNLNSHPSYQLVRNLRSEARSGGQFASGMWLAAGLISYSERGKEYISEIRSMISFNKLSDYDQAFRRALLGNDSRPLTQLASADTEKVLLPDQE